MSGIAGAIQFGSPATPPTLNAMLQAMASRGPDRQAVLCHNDAGFGQVLLATTPEALVEYQPWQHPDSQCIVVSDSRLDNRPQLLKELGISRPPDAVGDGELLHSAWQRWGQDCADHLRGDFSVAIWDPAGRELYLARDPMGVRPLAFHYTPGRLFAFASSVDAVIAHGQVPRRLNEGRLADALLQLTEGIDQTSTFYQDVERLPPAHWLRLRDGHMTRKRYWRPIGDKPQGLPQRDGEWVEAQREQLDRAVRARLRSHRPVGSMLSGGLDSSSVVALAASAYAETGQPPFPVFSATHSADPDCAETRAINAVIEHVRCAPHSIDLQEFARDPDPALRWWCNAGEPFDGTLSYVAALYRAAARQGVTSLMDGIPADNLFVRGSHARRLFGQGDWRAAWQAANRQWQIPGVTWPRAHALRVMAGCLMPEAGHALRQYLADRRNYRAALDDSFIDPAFADEVQLWKRYRRYTRTIRDAHQWHPTEEALSSMSAFYITAGLERYNRVASLFGVEPRPPFVDRQLIEFQAWVPIGLRSCRGHPKWILRQAMAGLLPEPVRWRTDRGHVGWRFNVAAMQHHYSGGQIPLAAPENPPFDAARVATAWAETTTDSTDGRLAAARTAAWLSSRESAPDLHEAALKLESPL